MARFLTISAVAALAAAASAPASAIPIFAAQYGVSCEKCHSVIPHLNAFGAGFEASGFRIPGVQPGPAFPIATKVNLVDSTVNQGSGPNGAGLAKAIVDEIELFTAGGIGSRASYYVEQYAVDGGEHGALREAWIEDRLNPWNSRIPLYAQAGQFTLPLVIDPETFRETYQGYGVYTQPVGANPFTFFDPHLGVRLSAGDPLRGLNFQFFAGPGYDRLSGLPKTGTDTMTELQDSVGEVTLGAYHYAGTRNLAGTFDAFHHDAAYLTVGQWTRFSSETFLQTGTDSDCGIAGMTACASSGGFEQLRYMFDRRLFAEARYEGTQDPTNGFVRDGVLLVGWAPAENARLTLEDVVSHQTRPVSTINLQGTVAF